jgi:hypothetical protein
MFENSRAGSGVSLDGKITIASVFDFKVTVMYLIDVHDSKIDERIRYSKRRKT